MYPICCAAGFPMPVKAGKMEVYGVSATVKNTAEDATLRLYDDRTISSDAKFGNILEESFEGPTEISYIKGLGNGSGVIEQWFAEPIKLRNGISVSISENVTPGSISVYIR
jgi:hypothetical protein